MITLLYPITGLWSQAKKMLGGGGETIGGKASKEGTTHKNNDGIQY